MSNWTDRDPGAGDRSAGISASSKVTALNTSVTTLSSALDVAISGTGSDVWASSAGDAFREGLQQPKSIAAQLIANFGTVSAALSAYATTVGSIKDSQQRAEDAYNTARNSWARWMATQQCDPDQPHMGLPPTPPLTVEDAAVRGVMFGSHYTYQAMWDASSSFRGLAMNRKAADDALVAALAPPAGWADIRRALADAGITNVDDLSTSSIADAFARFAGEFAYSEMSAEDAATMQLFFDTWGGDHSVMAQFFLKLGGESTAGLIDGLGQSTMAPDGLPDATALALALAVRNGLSNGSSRWTQATADAFAASLMTRVSPHPGELGSIANLGFLFSDAENSPMGEALTVAMANRIDELEREFGERWFDLTPDSGGLALARLESRITGLDPHRVGDLAGRVFSTLGQYPDAALDWLTDEDLGSTRVKYWFGDRDWSGADEFEGPITLWDGAIQAEGSLSTPPYDQATAERVAELTTRVMTELVENNESFDPRGFSDPAQMSLADGLTRMLPQISDILQGADGNWEDRPYRETSLLGSAEEYPIPNLTKEILGKLFGAMAYDEFLADGQPPAPTTSAAGLAFLAAADSYRDAITVMLNDVPLDSAFATDRLNEIASLYGMIDGSYVGGVLEAARLDDLETQQAIDGISAIVGALPLPAVSEVLIVGGQLGIDFAQNLTVGLLLDAGTDHVTTVWPTSTDTAISATGATEEEMYAKMEDRVRAALTELGYPEDAIEDRVELMMGDYEDSRDAGKWRAQ